MRWCTISASRGLTQRKARNVGRLRHRRQLLATWVVHDLGHIAQTVRVMAKQLGDAMWPWCAYLPIVDR